MFIPLVGSVHARKRKTSAKQKIPPVQRVDYLAEVRPILEAHCVRCHGPSSQKAGLRLDSADWIKHGSDAGAVIVPGNGAASDLIAVVSSAEDRPVMPPSGARLHPGEILTLKNWIDGGAKAPPSIESPPSLVKTLAEKHWAFSPPVRSSITSGGNPIDALLEVEREKHHLTTTGPASRATLLRRIWIDLVGVPPTREELQAFLADPSASAYEKVVDNLLASSRHGERWARHWMDVWRYSEADGRKAKADVWWSSPHLWRWRDRMIAMLNEDIGYDRMIAEMLAGDELAPDDPGTLASTGFLVRNWFKLDRNIWLGNTVDHTAKAFLGLTIGCAKCHDHKYDPISQVEYYRFRAVFEPHDVKVDTLMRDGEKVEIARVHDAHPTEPTWVFARGESRSPDKTRPIAPGVPLAIGGPAYSIRPIKGSAANRPASTGRRLALARWIGSRDNPLTARVAVNHIWARHFGTPLVENVADFGIRTKAPIQQALLDWLAVEFMESGWSLKHLHKLIVTSAAYQASSSNLGVPASTIAGDPDNHYYWRMNSKRLEAEALRDSLLWLADVLDPTIGGPPIDHMKGTETARRSLYYRYSREDKMEFLTTFDAPGVEECYRREQSIVPQQALALENSPFVWDQARRIARRLQGENGDFIEAAFEHVLGRAATNDEIAICREFLKSQLKLLEHPETLNRFPPSPPIAPPDPEVLKRVPGLPLVLGKAKSLPSIAGASDSEAQAREYLIHALLNHNDFITVR